jgi:exonuclease III
MEVNPEILCWNPRGLNDSAKRDSVREVVDSLRVSLVCLQETKMAVIDRFAVNQCLGPSFDGFDYLPAEETRGGILVAWNSEVLQVSNISHDSYSITGEVHSREDGTWWLTVVYGPQDTHDKRAFLDELSTRRSLCPGPWLIIGDFNMILHACEKNNENLDRRTMAAFRNFVNMEELKEVYMHGRTFTWSSERRVPTLSKIDRALVSVDWDLKYPNSLLQAISSAVSDHAPLHLSMNVGHHSKRRFRFELFWLNLEGFQEAVQEGWHCDDRITDPFSRLDECYRNLATHLQAWSASKVGNIKLQIAMANLVIHRLDAAQDSRTLTAHEWWLRRSLKHLVLGLSSLERTMARQRSRMRWIKDGDANSKLFHAVANGRRRRNFIPSIKHNGEVFTDQSRKEEIFFDAYSGLLGQINNREFSLDLEALGLPSRGDLLEDLGGIFSEEEVWKVIKEIPADRAPGPDGFVGAFYHKAWAVIKPEIMAAILKLYVGDGRGFGQLNRALITLVPKKMDAQEVGDYRPISLIHSFAKLFSKILANRLRPKMEELVSPNQSAFIKGRNLHDNFILVRQLARKINSRREAGVLLKLDISRAFDSISWSFLLEVLQRLGFPTVWLRWIIIALRTASTRVVVNGMPGRKFMHARGLRQGDPLSPQLFVIAMEVATMLFCRATDQGLLAPVGNCSQIQRISIFADDVVLFVKPTITDLVTIRELLEVFGEATGLRVNYRKTTATIIRGDGQDRELVADVLRCQIAEFPIKYLGLQLALKPLTKAQWQPMIDAAIRIAPAWQSGLLSKQGRLVLVQAVMTARPVHHLLITEAPVWVIEELDKSFRGFFWAAKDRANGGQCLVAWDRVCKPKSYGGLGIKNLSVQGLALRIRWEWLRRTDPARPWQGLPMIKDAQAREAFDSLVHIQVGVGSQVLFWRDRWIHGRSASEFAPGITQHVPMRVKNARTVQQALQNNRWMLDIQGSVAILGARECVRLWLAISSVARDVDSPDRFRWPWTSGGEYSASSAYSMMMEGSIRWELGEIIWKSKATPKSKLFVWLAAQHRIWTSDRRLRHGLQTQSSPCFLCLQEEDTAEHILVQCVFAREVWYRCRQALRLTFDIPTSDGTIQSWWTRERVRFSNKDRKWFDGLVCTVCHGLWKNRNAFCFNNVQRQYTAPTLVAQILEEFRLIRCAHRVGEGVFDNG